MRKNTPTVENILGTCNFKQPLEVSFNTHASYDSKKGMVNFVVPIGEESEANQLEPMRGNYFGQIEGSMWLIPSKGEEIMIDKRTIATVRKIYLDRR